MKQQFDKQRNQIIRDTEVLVFGQDQQSQESPNLNLYIKFFQNLLTLDSDQTNLISLFRYIKQQRLKLIEQLKEKQVRILKEYQDIQSPQEFQFCIQVQNNSQNWEIAYLKCKYAIFQQTFTVLNLKQQSQMHQFNVGGIGSTSNAYFCKNQFQKFAIKCIKVKQNNLNGKLFIFRQFFIIKILSALKLTAEVKKIFGFDLIIYPNCIQFAIQICQRLNKQIQNLQQLKKDLLKIHSLKIVHCDIKSANILFSQTYQKYVFIDFGLSQIIKQNIGQSSYSCFKGTYSNCGKQMKRLLQNKNKKINNNKVDLYYNDVQSFRIFQSQFKAQLLKQKCNYQDQKKVNLNSIGSQLYYYYIKSFLQLKEYQKARYYAEKMNSIHFPIFQQKIISYLHYKQIDKQLFNFCKTFFRNTQTILKIANCYHKKINVKLNNQTRSLLNYFQNYYTYFKGKTLKRDSIFVSIQMRQIRKIILQKDQAEKLSKQMYLDIFVDFISFWKNKYLTSAQEKQKACKIFNQIFQINHQSNIKLQLFKNSYNDYDHLPAFNTINDENIQQVINTYEYLLGTMYENKFQGSSCSLSLNLIKQVLLIGFNLGEKLQLLMKSFMQSKQNQLSKIQGLFQIGFLIFRFFSDKLFSNTQFSLKNYLLFFVQSTLKTILQQSYSQFNYQKQIKQNYHLNQSFISKQIIKFSQTVIYLLDDLALCLFSENYYLQNYIYQRMHSISHFKSLFAQIKSKLNIRQLNLAIKLLKITFYFCQMYSSLNNPFDIDEKYNETNFQKSQQLINISNSQKIIKQTTQSASEFTLNKIITKIDQKIRCQSIGLTIYTAQRVKVAFYWQQYQILRKIIILLQSSNIYNCQNFQTYINLTLNLKEWELKTTNLQQIKCKNKIYGLCQIYFKNFYSFLIRQTDQKYKLDYVLDSCFGLKILRDTSYVIMSIYSQEVYQKVILLLSTIQNNVSFQQMNQTIFTNILQIYKRFSLAVYEYVPNIGFVFNKYFQMCKIGLQLQGFTSRQIQCGTLLAFFQFFWKLQANFKNKQDYKYSKILQNIKIYGQFINNNDILFFYQMLCYFLIIKSQNKIIQLFLFLIQYWSKVNQNAHQKMLLGIHINSFPLNIILLNQKRFQILQNVSDYFQQLLDQKFNDNKIYVWFVYIYLKLNIVLDNYRSIPKFKKRTFLILLQTIKISTQTFKQLCLQYVFNVLYKSYVRNKCSEKKILYLQRKKYKNKFQKKIIYGKKQKIDIKKLKLEMISLIKVKLKKTNISTRTILAKIMKKLNIYKFNLINQKADKNNQKQFHYFIQTYYKNSSKFQQKKRKGKIQTISTQDSLQKYFWQQILTQTGIQIQEIQQVLINYCEKNNILIEQVPLILYNEQTCLWELKQ